MRTIHPMLCWAALAALLARPAFAGVTGSIVGTVHGPQGAPLAGATVAVEGGGTALSATTQAQGGFRLLSLPFGDYSVRVLANGYAPGLDSVSVGSDAVVPLDVSLKPLSVPAQAESEDLSAVTIQSTRIRINRSSAVSSQEINQTQISQLPGGTTQSLPKVLFTTNPGFVQGSFGQVFSRGNHANMQYDIDGIQLPDSVSGTFGDAFSVLNIDRMEVITGGLPAEYGNRLSAVVNILTKSGTQAPGGFLDMNYGSYNTFSPQAVYGGSADGGHLRYFLSGGYESTDRGLDTPEPASENDERQGGTSAVHDTSVSNNQFAKLDWDLDEQDTLMFTAFNSQRTFQIPNYPAGFNPGDSFFSPTYSDEYGNVGGASWAPYNTDDYQIEGSDYAEVMWKHRFEDDSLLQLAPYVKMSSVIFNGDPSADLAGASDGSSDGNPVTDDSFAEDRVTSDLGVQGDYSAHLNEANTVKTGFQLQAAEAHGPISIEYQSTGGAVTTTGQNGADHDYQESVYVQDDITLVKNVVLNAGLRYDAIQDLFADASSVDGMFQPRLGLNYTPWALTKFHLYYGELFQPAPAEDLRDSFSQVSGNLTPYDIKSEKDDYYEAGVAQQLSDQLVSLNTYYKSAVNLLDDTQLLNTAITEPYNYAQGYVYGTELSVNGHFAEHFSDFLTYSYEIAQGYGASGGLFALSQADLQTAEAGGDDFWQYLDHCQIDSANAGLTYSLGGFTVGATGLYGSGLRTGFDNEVSLPPHFTVDGTLSYAITGKSWLDDVKLQLDVTNIFDDVYPIFVDNGFNGSHYVAPTGFMVHLIKTL
ncbi:MAG TPA: TonB-dependent receptor [bacterium]|nr:TonB-dependent receptor [bacterium]